MINLVEKEYLQNKKAKALENGELVEEEKENGPQPHGYSRGPYKKKKKDDDEDFSVNKYQEKKRKAETDKIGPQKKKIKA